MSNSWPWPESIEEFKKELIQARMDVVELAPDSARLILFGGWYSDSLADWDVWNQSVVDKIIGLAVPEKTPDFPPPYVSTPTAYCPLCREGTKSVYGGGYTIPEGLSRHLSLYGRMKQCKVMEAAFWLAHVKHLTLRLAADEQSRAQAAQRRIAETLYQLRPYEAPKLLDEDLGREVTPRTEKELAWGEARLGDLGFRIVDDGNVKSYLRDDADIRAFADLRAVGIIRVVVFRQIPTTAPRYRKAGVRSKLLGTFTIKDDERHNLGDLFQRGLRGCVDTTDGGHQDKT